MHTLQLREPLLVLHDPSSITQPSGLAESSVSPNLTRVPDHLPPVQPTTHGAATGDQSRVVFGTLKLVQLCSPSLRPGGASSQNL